MPNSVMFSLVKHVLVGLVKFGLVRFGLYAIFNLVVGMVVCLALFFFALF